MKVNKMCGIILGLFVLVSAMVFASVECPTKEEYRATVKDAVRNYFTNPSHEKLLEVKDMLKVYATHDFTKCLEIEEKETCSDGTAYGSCSNTKPLYCDGGALVDSCQLCGCPLDEECQEDGSCKLEELYKVIEVDDRAGSVGEIIEFTVSVEDVPSDVKAFGFSVFYDSNVLEYTGDYERGLVIEKFQFFEVNEAFEGKLNIGGFTTKNVIKKGSSGGLVKLGFKVLKCEESFLEIKELLDDMTGWSEAEGGFECET